MKHIAFSTLLFFAAVVAYAAIPPTIPPEKLPPAVYADMPVPHHEAPRAVRGSQPRPASVEEIRRMPVSSALYFAMLEELRHGSSALAIESAESLLIGTVRESSTRSTSTSANHRPVVVQAYGQTPVNATSDSNQDVEPSVAAVNIGGTMHTTTVATK